MQNGGVIACAAIAAVSLGSQFTPKSDGDYLDSRGVAQDHSSVEGGEPAAGSQTTAPLAQADLNGFAEDAELIDDTSGFDPSPSSMGDVIVSSDNSSNNGFAEATVKEQPRAPRRAKPSVFKEYNPKAGRVQKSPKADLYPPDPPPGKPFPKDRKIITLVEPSGG